MREGLDNLTGLWPTERAALKSLQGELAARRDPVWEPGSHAVRLGGVFVCFPCGGTGAGDVGDPGWAGAAVVTAGRVQSQAAVAGEATAPYEAGMLAGREGRLLHAAADAVVQLSPDVWLVNATGRDHPRRAGLALHFGVALGVPSVGVTNRPLYARGPWPEEQRGATSPLILDGEVVACWLRIRPSARPLVVQPGHRIDLDTAVTMVLQACGEARTPLPIRAARQAARAARAHDQGRSVGPAGPLPRA